MPISRIKTDGIQDDAITSAKIGDTNIQSADIADGSVTFAKLAVDAQPTPTQVSDQTNTSTGGFSLPAGTTAQRPGTPDTGETRFNSTTGSIEFYDGTSWIATNLIPTVDSISGTIYAGSTSNLTLTLTNATDTIDVVFSESGSNIATVSGVSVSSGSATVSVPAAVYGQTAGDTIAISITNQDGTPSSNAPTVTVTALPSGGTITTSGNYRIHTFTSSGTFTNTISNLSVEYLVIAGGGGVGARRHAGGGGAGGYRCSVSGETSGRGASAESPLTLTTGNKTVTVGAGGASSPSGSNTNSGANNGSNSVFDSITSLGGGYGTTYDGGAGQSGGCGGGSGASGGSTSGGSGTSGQGYDGGAGEPNTGGGGGGGGGGAGSAGSNAPGSDNGGNGGNGVASSITGSSVTRAGGGGGGGSTASTAGSGGSGGGGAGANTTQTPQSGTVNTGGGAGAGGADGDQGQTGGSGIVIVRYDTTAI